jgi:hypothetical protein
VLGNTALVPLVARVLWVVGLGALLASRWLLRDARPVIFERAARAALSLVAVYIVALVAASAGARAEARAVLAATGVGGVEDVMVAPVPANPFGGAVIVVTRDDYLTGSFDWLATPHLALDNERIPRPRGPAFAAAAQAREVRNFLTWSRFPSVDLESTADGGVLVRFSDVRYRGGEGLGGPTVRLDREFRLLPAP